MTILLGTLGLGLGTLIVHFAGRSLKGTTLVGAWRWAIVTLVAWWLPLVSHLVVAPQGVCDRLSYAAAVLSLTPLVHVLGARRPVSRSWTWFVVLPMLAVLGLPLVTAWGTVEGLNGFEIEWPSLCGYLIVLVMGAGNYFGTRFTAPVAWYALGLAVIVVTGSTARPGFVTAPSLVRALGLACLVWSLVSAARHASAPETERDLDRLWIEFRDLFGIVWAKRVMDRVNESLAGAGLPSRLELDGLAIASETSVPDQSTGEREHAEKIVRDTFSWLLRRFVDSPWAARFGVKLRGTDTSPER